MIKTVKTKDLEAGMYVLLPKSWFAHPFIKNEFVISSSDQIDKIIQAKIYEVSIDTEKSTYKNPEPVKIDIPTLAKKDIDVPKKEEKDTLPVIPPALQEVIADKKISAPEKAKAIHKHSTVMIQRIMENPSSENINEAKKGISQVVDVILADDNTNKQLLSITYHDYSTYVHSVNVGLLGVALSKSLFKNSSAHNMHELGAGFFLHDLGKVKVDINIILKPSVLTDEEIQAMRKHPQFGYDILDETHQLTEECKRIVLQHHERFDGRGYPLQLKGEDIHLYGRICSIADVFDALASKRPYRKGLRPFEALNIMKSEMLDHFHKELFQKFVMLFS